MQGQKKKGFVGETKSGLAVAHEREEFGADAL
jgi:hypothetical protein